MTTLTLAIWTLGLSVLAPVAPRQNAAIGELRRELVRTVAEQGYRFTPIVRSAYLSYAKRRARAELAQWKKKVPASFLAWIDSDPAIAAGVYGARADAALVILQLYSLRQDLGKKDFEEYRQLALAAAIVYKDQGREADLSQRAKLELSIGGDPRQRVNTRDPKRKLDKFDHIINFLESRTIQGPPLGMRGEPKATSSEASSTSRTLIAADVIASAALQKEFNRYMAEKGFPVHIDCGDRVVHLKSKAAVKGPRRAQIRAAFELFKSAYEAKGLLPKKRDPAPSPAEICAYLIRNDKYLRAHPPAKVKGKKKSKAFYYPLTAPWPTLTLLVENNQPLREREERWKAYLRDGTFVTYGEYIGPIAQQFDMQSARRLSPFPFTYRTVQMMLKDGGVCGAMANISVRSRITLGIPSCTAGQPGHCALIYFYRDPKSGKFDCRGGQYVTGGHDKTTPHGSFQFGNPVRRKVKRGRKTRMEYPRYPMIYHRSVAWAVNHGMASFMDSTMAFHLFLLLPKEKQARATALLFDALRINPFNIILIARAQDAATSPEQVLRQHRVFSSILDEAEKAGTHIDSLYRSFFKKRAFQKIAKLPLPSSKKAQREILSVLERENDGAPAATIRYQVAMHGIRSVTESTKRALREQLTEFASTSRRENDAAAEKMAALIKATVAAIPKRRERRLSAARMWKLIAAQPHYFGKRNKMKVHPAWKFLLRASRSHRPTDLAILSQAMQRIRKELRKAFAGPRRIAESRALAARIASVAKAIKDKPAKERWLHALKALMKGREEKTGKGTQRKRPDPCVTTVQKLLAR